MSEPAAEPGVVDPAAPEPSEPAWQAPSQTEWQDAQDQLAAYEYQLQQMQQPQMQQYPAVQQAPSIPDPGLAFEDQAEYQRQMEAYLDHRMAPYQQFQQQVALAQAEEEAMSILDGLAEQGDFDRQQAWARANQIVGQIRNDPRTAHLRPEVAAQRALEQAARDQREFERRVGEAYYQRQLEQIQQAAGQPRGPMGANMNGTQAAVVGGYGNGPNAVTRRMFGGG